VDSSGNVFVADQLNKRIQKFTSSGTFLTKFGDSSINSYPKFVVVDGSGNVFVTWGDRIVKFNSSYQVVTTYKNTAYGAGGISLEGGGNIVVSDSGNDQINKFSQVWAVRLDKVEVIEGSKTKRTRYEYDQYGNVTRVYRDGDTSTSTDDSTVIKEYHPTETNNDEAERAANTSSNSGTEVYGSNWRAQTFKSTTNEPFLATKVRLYLGRLGSPGDVTVSIRDVDDNGKPTGSDLTSATLDSSNIPTSPNWVDFDIPDIHLGANIKFAIVFRAPDGNSSNYINWQYYNSNSYGWGELGTSPNSGQSWTMDSSGDHGFAVWGKTYNWILNRVASTRTFRAAHPAPTTWWRRHTTTTMAQRTTPPRPPRGT
jgi:hypothetical protein